MEEAVGSEYLFPRRTECGNKPYLCGLKKVWRSTLRCARVSYFSLYELRHTFATRLSAGGVAGYFVTLMLRQGRAGVFKRYSQAKLNVMREALDRLDPRANEHERGFGTETALRMGMERNRILKIKEIAGGDDGARTRDLMRDSNLTAFHIFYSSYYLP